MTDLVVRRLLVDLDTPFDRHWAGGDPFVSAWFDALSMSFPRGEQFFIDSVRAGVQALPEGERVRFADEVKAFVGQEATHRRLHELFNRQLAAQGYVNAWEGRIEARSRIAERLDPRHGVAATAATEHLTAIMAVYMLEAPQQLEGAEPRLRTLWLWHAAEESEHRSTAFDLYRAMGGNEPWRRRHFWLVTGYFLTDVLRQTADNLRRDGQLWRWSTWRSGWRFLFGAGGLVREVFGPWRAYLRADFHPRQLGGDLGRAWLERHPQAYRVVGDASA
jgi:predicted metal-dependent hydrolase